MAWTAWTERLTVNARAIANGVKGWSSRPSSSTMTSRTGPTAAAGRVYRASVCRPRGDVTTLGRGRPKSKDVPVLPVACCPLPSKSRCASAHGGRWHRRRPPQEWRMEARRFRLGAAEGRASRGKSHPSRVDLLRGRWWDAKPGGGRPCGRLSASTMWPDNVPSPSPSLSSAVLP